MHDIALPSSALESTTSQVPSASVLDTLDLVRTNGGEVLDGPSPDGTERWLATIRDPGGNVLGIVQNRPQ